MKRKHSNNDWESHNITKEIGQYADKLGLDCICTGGNCDYIYRDMVKSFGSETNSSNDYLAVVLYDAEGGECPEKLSSPSYVSIKLDRDWIASVDMKFPNAKKAMEFMGNLTDCFHINIGEMAAK
jgi:hypothetical protein